MDKKEISEAAATLGRKGGSAKTPAKVSASRENGKKGGRPAEKGTKNRYYIVSGEGENGTVKLYNGKLTARAIKARLTREKCGGDRWARIDCDIDGDSTKRVRNLDPDSFV